METLTSGPTRTTTPTPGNPIHRENRNDAGTRQHKLRDDPHQKARLHISRAADEPDERADRGKQRVRPHRNAQKCCGLLNDRRVGIKTGGKLGGKPQAPGSDVPRAAPAERMIAFHNPFQRPLLPAGPYVLGGVSRHGLVHGSVRKNGKAVDPRAHSIGGAGGQPKLLATPLTVSMAGLTMTSLSAVGTPNSRIFFKCFLWKRTALAERRSAAPPLCELYGADDECRHLRKHGAQRRAEGAHAPTIQ